MTRKIELAELALAIGLAAALLYGAIFPTACWWGVVFDPLCAGVTTGKASAEVMAQEDGESGEGYEIRFKSAELLESLRARFAK